MGSAVRDRQLFEPSVALRTDSTHRIHRDSGDFLSASADACVIALCATIAIWLRSVWLHTDLTASALRTQYVVTLLFIFLFCAFSYSKRLDRTLMLVSGWRSAWIIAREIGFSGLIVAALLYTAGMPISRSATIGTIAMSGVGVIASKLVHRRIRQRRVIHGLDCRNVLIVGAGRVGRALGAFLEKNKQLGYRVCGYVDCNPEAHEFVLGSGDDLEVLIRSEFVDEVFITVPSERDLVKRIARLAAEHQVEAHVVPDLFDGLGWGAPLEYLGQFPILSLHYVPELKIQSRIKRLIDVLFSAIGLIVIAPVLVLVAIAIKLESKGPVLYAATRVGKRGREFRCLKFRTMLANADEMKRALEHLNERSGVLFKISNDPRITRVGRFLRKYSIDELPQLLNVLAGHMSLVGPRPCLPSEFANYDPEHMRRLEVTPGITGLWQVEARTDPSFESYISLDTQYVTNWNLLLDLKILLRTISTVLAGTGQ